MLGHAKMIFEKGYVYINSKHDKLITSLRTAVENEGALDKEVTSYDDIFDAFRLTKQKEEKSDKTVGPLKFYSYKGEI